MRGNGCYIAGSNWFVEIIWGKILENKNVLLWEKGFNGKWESGGEGVVAGVSELRAPKYKAWCFGGWSFFILYTPNKTLFI